MTPDRDEMFDRLPPHSVEAEQCVLASMMLEKEMRLELCTLLTASNFYLTDHQLIFAAIRDLAMDQKNVDAVILRDELKTRGQLDAVGGSPYIATLLSAVPSAAHGVEYANRVKEHATLRGVISTAEWMLRKAYDHSDSTDVITDGQARLTILVTKSQEKNVYTIGEIASEVAQDIFNPDPLQFNSFGFPTMDKMLGGGISEGEYMVLGARTSMGKSTLARQMSLLMAMGGTPTMMFSLEDPRKKSGRNILSWLTQIENRRLRSGEIKDHEFEIIGDTAAKLKGIPWYFVWGVDRAEAIRSMSLAYVAKHGVRCVFVDYLQRVDAGGKTDFERATLSSGAISRIAKRDGIPTIATAQLNRGSQYRESNRPTMTDLRSSGQIEQDADIIGLLHREDYYHKNEAAYQPSNEAELIIEKQRDGETGTTVWFNSCLEFQCFEDRDELAAKRRAAAPPKSLFHHDKGARL